MAFDVSWIFEAQDAFTPVAKKIQGSVVSLEKSMQKLGKQTIKIGKQTSRIGRGMTTHISAPLGILGGLSLDVAAKFERAMKIIAVKTGASANQMAKLKKQVMDLAMARGITPLNILNAQIELTKAGFEDFNQIITLTPKQLKLMQATGSDAASAANAMSAIMVVAGGNMKEFNQDLDLMSKAYNLGGINAQDFETSIKYVGGSAKAVGWDMKDLTAAMVTTSQMGMTSSDTMMALKMSLMRLARPSKQVNAILKKAGIEIYDPHTKKLKKLIPVIDQLNKAQKKWGERINMSALLGMVFGRSATELFQKLMQQRKMLVGYRKDMDNVGGTMDKLANIQITGLMGQMARLHATFQVLQEAFMSDQAIDAIQGWVKYFRDLIEKLSKLSPSTKFFIDKMVAFGIVLGPVIMAFGKIIIGLGMLLIVFGKLPRLIGGIIVGFKLLTTGLFGWVGVAITAIAVIDHLYKKYEKFRDVLKDIAEFMKVTVFMPYYAGRAVYRGAEAMGRGIEHMIGMGAPPTAGRISPHPLSMQQQVAHALHININDKGKNIESIHGTDKRTKVTMNSTGLNMAYSRLY